MRKCLLLLLFTVVAVQVSASSRVTVDQLEQALAPAPTQKDADLARQLSTMELTERLSPPRFERLKAQMPGEKSRQALIAMADAAEFLDLPASDILADAPPDRPAQEAILARTKEYLKKTISKWPDFFATEDTIHFADAPLKPPRHSNKPPPDRILRLADKSSATVRYIGGKGELLVAAEANEKKSKSPGKPLSTQGVFGSILDAVLTDALGSNPAWGHWERGPGGPRAVFRYAVPHDKSHYGVHALGDPGFLVPITGYRGEFAVDPAGGALLRLTVVADLWLTGPIAKADLLVEYAPVDIGGKTYICPSRSVAISLARPFNNMQDIYGFHQNNPEPFQMQLNDVAFAQYHQFRSEIRILPGTVKEPSGAAPDRDPVPMPPEPAKH